MKFTIKTDKEVEVTKEDFADYERVRENGETNMFDIRQVVELSENLDGDKAIAIQMNYRKLCETYPDIRTL